VSSANKFLDSLIDYERNIAVNYKFKLDRFRGFLQSIGSPQEKLKNCILIAGTKGKGSTAAFLDSALRACGLKTGLYTSPHIFSASERIKFSGREISHNDLLCLVNKIKSPARKFDITYFEAMTAMAFLHFLEKKPDYTILEVGLGGRLDATNVVTPLISVITRIGYDHTNILGKTLTRIAREKAEIIHSRSFVVISQQRPTALKVIKNKVRTTNSKYFDTAKEISIIKAKTDITGSVFTIKNKGRFGIRLLGKHQIENACTAIGVLSFLQSKDSRITENCVKEGLKNTQMLARCQIISKNPLIIVDGAHNPESVSALNQVIHNIIRKKVVVIFGSSQGKLVKEMFKILSPVTEQFILTQSENPRHIPVSELADILKPFKIPFITTKSVKKAVEKGMELAKRKTPLIITGSFYVASETLKIFN
jgi:dihydrofolate synthase / folylpolyglutamate synthase